MLFPPERPHFIMALLCEHTLHFLHFTASTFASGEPCVSVRVRVRVRGGPFFCWISAEPDPRRYTTRTPVYMVPAARERSTLPCRLTVPAWSFQANLLLPSNLGLSAVLAGFTWVGLGLNYLWAPAPQVSCKQVGQGVAYTQIKAQVFPTTSERDAEGGRPPSRGTFDAEGIWLCRVRCTSANGQSQEFRIGCFSCRQTAGAPRQKKPTWRLNN